MLSNEQKQYILDKYQSGISINSIANNLGVSWDTVKRFLLKENISLVKNVNQYKKQQNLDYLFQKIDSHDAAYWLGFLYADGNIRSNRNEISLELKEEDFKAIQNYHIFCNNHNTIREHIIKRNGIEYKSYVSSFSNKQVKENLKNLGCIPKKTLILDFPSYKQVPDEFLWDFIRGYFDGDGYCRFDLKNHKYDIVILGTEKFLNGLLERTELENIAKINSTATKIFSLNIYKKENVFDFLKKMYDNNFQALERKKNIFLQVLNSGL